MTGVAQVFKVRSLLGAPSQHVWTRVKIDLAVSERRELAAD